MIRDFDYNTSSNRLFSVDNKVSLLPSYLSNEHIDNETRFNMNYSSESSGEEYDFDNMGFDGSLKDIILINSIYSDNKDEFPSSFEKSILTPKEEKISSPVKQDDNILKKKRSPTRKPRRENWDNIRKKIRRGFFNNFLIKKLCHMLRNIGNKKYFMKFPQNFASDINQKRNKEIFGMTLQEILEKKELYLKEDESGLNNYLHNSKVVQSVEIKENKEFKKILEKKICELYEEYINSDEFKNDEIKRLKEKKMQDEYITNFINLANHLLIFYTQ